MSSVNRPLEFPRNKKTINSHIMPTQWTWPASVFKSQALNGLYNGGDKKMTTIDLRQKTIEGLFFSQIKNITQNTRR